MLFFTLPNSQNAAVISGGGFFSWGTKFKYTGRTEREILTESINAIRDQKLAIISSNCRKASSVPTTPSSPQADIEQIRYSSLPRSTMSEPLNNYTAGVRDGLTHVSYCMFDENGKNIMELTDKEPNIQEENIRTFATYNHKNVTDIFSMNEDTANNTNRSEDILMSASSMSAKTCGCGSHMLNKKSVHMLNSIDLVKYNSEEHNSKYSKLNVAKSSSIMFNRNSRKFRFVHAFVPSFIFVVLAMLISAIVILESESDILKQFRNIPEMISLRFQYYQPIKDYVLKHVGYKR